MPTLYQLSDEIRALQAAMDATEDAEFQERLTAFFAGALDQAEQKVDSYCCLIRELEASYKARQEEAERLSYLATTDKLNADRLKSRLKQFLDQNGYKRFETDKFKLTVAQNGGKAPLEYPREWDDDPRSAPEQFHRRVIQLDREAIRVAAENGETEDAAIGERGTHLRIR